MLVKNNDWEMKKKNNEIAELHKQIVLLNQNMTVCESEKCSAIFRDFIGFIIMIIGFILGMAFAFFVCISSC